MNITDVMRRAVAAYGRRDFSGALREAEQASRAQPDNAAVQEFIGVVLCSSGDVAAGLARLERALVLNPGNASLRFNAAKAALDLGDLTRAGNLAQPLSGHPDGERLLAEIARASQDTGSALERYARLAQQRPNDHEVLNNFGNALAEAGRADDAVAVFRRAVALAPRSPQVLLGLGRALAAGNDHAGAREAFIAAASLGSADNAVRIELGKSLLRQGLHEAALLQLSEAVRGGDRSAQVFVLIGVCLAALERREEAEQAFDAALQADPASPRAYLNLAILYEQENRIESLRALAERAQRAIPAGPDRDYIEALVLRRDGREREALALVDERASDSLDPVVRQQFIGQLADKLGEYDRAFAAFAAMNGEMTHHPEATALSGTEHAAAIDRNTAIITPSWYASWRDAPPTDARHSPAFLGGFLRSGTTLLDTILMGHPALTVREEEPMLARLEEAAGSLSALPDMDSVDVTRMRDAYFAEAAANGPLPADRLLIDKYPLMTLRSGYIHRAFPDARFIFALRHPCDVVLSCWMQNFRITQAMASFLTLENAARMYAAAMSHWMNAREVMPLAVHTVRYEDMVRDLEGELRPLIAFLGLPWDDALLSHQQTAADRGYIRTPSYAQVTEPVYARASGRWTKYRTHLEPILPILAPWCERFGYSLD